MHGHLDGQIHSFISITAIKILTSFKVANEFPGTINNV